MAWHPAVPSHQQIPTELKYSKRKENLQVHVIFRLSTAFGYIIHDRRKPTSNSAHLQNDDVTLSHSAMKTNSVPVTINIIRGAFWGKLGYTAAFGYTENGMTWYKIRNELLK